MVGFRDAVVILEEMGAEPEVVETLLTEAEKREQLQRLGYQNAVKILRSLFLEARSMDSDERIIDLGLRIGQAARRVTIIRGQI